jgi:hypothetical protein
VSNDGRPNANRYAIADPDQGGVGGLN